MEAQSTIAQSRVGALFDGRYELGRLVGDGGMGAVYEARNRWTGRRVAIKVLHPELAQRPEVLARFLQEAQAATRVAHRNVIEVLDLGQNPDDGAYYLVQEFLEGTDLRALLDEAGPLTPRRALEIITPVMAALVAAHAAGVVHRDLKPENIFLARGADGALVPKLIDFGVSKLLDPSSAPLSRTLPGTTLGTPSYMSPEQCRGDADLDARSDVWGVGAVLYEMLSGALPFEAPNYNSLIVKIVTSAPPPLTALAPGVPAALAQVIHRALTSSLAARLPSMADFLAAVSACPLEGASLVPPPPARAARAEGDDGSSATPMQWAATVAHARAATPRRRAAVPALTGLAMACALLVAFATRGAPVHSAPFARSAAATIGAPIGAPPRAVARVHVVEVPVITAPPRAAAPRAAAVRRVARAGAAPRAAVGAR